jgi:hypothetical protein
MGSDWFSGSLEQLETGCRINWDTAFFIISQRGPFINRSIFQSKGEMQ